ncbi:hypothetical protein [Roseibium aggregatum]|uniref:Uncharacterized protein n=1 Tax=Roseibium aggregatum TaxID=187304 RepID=A0A939EGH3_9HYPH|nr:hypothetical protein [Roseibium aggregatum]MBN9672514.1 hypothetical protein [Roseibium aggregatum]
MHFETYRDSYGERWQFNPEAVERVILAYEFMSALPSKSNLRQEKLGPLSGTMPVIDCDIKKAKELANREFKDSLDFFHVTRKSSGRRAFDDLVYYMSSTRQMRGIHQNYVGTIAKYQKIAIDRTTRNIEMAKFARDTGFTIVMIYANCCGASLVGAGAAAIGAGGKGVAKYQDTGKFDAAAIESLGQLVGFGWGAAASVGKVEGIGKGIMVGLGMIQGAAFTVGAGSVEKKPASETLTKIGLDVLTGLAGEGVSHFAGKRLQQYREAYRQAKKTIDPDQMEQIVGTTSGFVLDTAKGQVEKAISAKKKHDRANPSLIAARSNAQRDVIMNVMRKC